mmetsp:Transcript_28110/g.71263  ORF Transcript_28110/g.71263 Transcript_28110/m.71263 type:complete len:201 (+) Transcript_28110:3168-3770(+)
MCALTGEGRRSCLCFLLFRRYGAGRASPRRPRRGGCRPALVFLLPSWRSLACVPGGSTGRGHRVCARPPPGRAVLSPRNKVVFAAAGAPLSHRFSRTLAAFLSLRHLRGLLLVLPDLPDRASAVLLLPNSRGPLLARLFLRPTRSGARHRQGAHDELLRDGQRVQVDAAPRRGVDYSAARSFARFRRRARSFGLAVARTS